MSASSVPEDQLIELLLHLHKTKPEEARSILNQQPQISYALIALMVKLNAINVEVMTNHLASYGVPTGPTRNPNAPPPVATAPQAYNSMTGSSSQRPAHLPLDTRGAYPPAPANSFPAGPGGYPHGTQPQAATTSTSHTGYPNSSPPSNTSPPAHTQQPGYDYRSHGGPGAAPNVGGWSQGVNYGGGGYGRNPAGPPGYRHPPAPGPGPQQSVPDAFAHLPEDQKALLMRMVAMTPEEIQRLPPTERANVIQLRATLGLPTS